MCSRKSETGLSGSGAEGYIHRPTFTSAVNFFGKFAVALIRSVGQAPKAGDAIRSHGTGFEVVP
jgi:hypothetical protein